MSSPRIAVIGAGVGGLACARGLQVHGHPVTVFEREASAAARWQGGMLDLHAPTGQAALRAVGLSEQFRVVARPEAQELRMLDPVTAAMVHHEQPAEDEYFAPEVDRGQLRELLLDSLTPGTVHWGHSVDGVTAQDDGTARVHFGDGTTEVFDLVVGADGAWSRTRPAVSAATPTYTGNTLVETFLDDVDTRHPALANLIGSGSMVAGAGPSMLGAQRNSGGHVRVYASFEDIPIDWHVTAGIDLADTEAVREHLLARFDGWHDSLLDLIRRSDGGFVNRPIHVLPVGHTWDHVPGVTLLGDAAHLLPPHGIGANLALIDGSDLATAVATHADLDEAARAYENVMLPRSTAAAHADSEVSALMDEDPVHNVSTARQFLNERLLNPGTA
ncbi:NAD(P)/FAD-dependent oxidoreductase [Kutzneria viridogrisea]|uniref:Flavin-dependent monooxygenase n=1 Tax=Kutzneria viridogrisea TaxID=47990 RepID=A0ABR6BVJ0_9PSEU|nr:2-polyprenyl-6-methoxyphenol hydroxylase-like FAD-dependent oxidoreductase [Kutzneria viridogrisea]